MLQDRQTGKQNKINIMADTLKHPNNPQHKPQQHNHQQHQQQHLRKGVQNPEGASHKANSMEENQSSISDNYEEVHWSAAYMDGKFYLAHPLALDRLLKLNAEIKMEKKKLMFPEYREAPQRQAQGAEMEADYNSEGYQQPRKEQDNNMMEGEAETEGQGPRQAVNDITIHTDLPPKKNKLSPARRTPNNNNHNDTKNRTPTPVSQSSFSILSRECRTEVNQLKALRMQLETQKQLREEQDKYHHMIEQLRIKNRTRRNKQVQVMNTDRYETYGQGDNKFLMGINNNDDDDNDNYNDNDDVKVSQKKEASKHHGHSNSNRVSRNSQIRSRKSISIRSHSNRSSYHSSQNKKSFMFAPNELTKTNRVPPQQNRNQNNIRQGSDANVNSVHGSKANPSHKNFVIKKNGSHGKSVQSGKNNEKQERYSQRSSTNKNRVLTPSEQKNIDTRQEKVQIVEGQREDEVQEGRVRNQNENQHQQQQQRNERATGRENGHKNKQEIDRLNAKIMEMEHKLHSIQERQNLLERMEQQSRIREEESRVTRIENKEQRHQILKDNQNQNGQNQKQNEMNESQHEHQHELQYQYEHQYEYEHEHQHEYQQNEDANEINYNEDEAQSQGIIKEETNQRLNSPHQNQIQHINRQNKKDEPDHHHHYHHNQYQYQYPEQKQHQQQEQTLLNNPARKQTQQVKQQQQQPSPAERNITHLLIQSSTVNYNYNEHANQLQDRQDKEDMQAEIEELNKVIRQLKLDKIRQEEARQQKQKLTNSESQASESPPNRIEQKQREESQAESPLQKNQIVKQLPSGLLNSNNKNNRNQVVNKGFTNQKITLPHTINHDHGSSRRYDYDSTNRNNNMRNHRFNANNNNRTICINPSYYSNTTQEELPIPRKLLDRGNHQQHTLKTIDQEHQGSPIREIQREQVEQPLANFGGSNINIAVTREKQDASKEFPKHPSIVTKSLENSGVRSEMKSQILNPNNFSRGKHNNNKDHSHSHSHSRQIFSSRQSQQFANKALNKKGVIVRQVPSADQQKTDYIPASQSPHKDSYCCDEEPPSPTYTGKKIFELEFVKKNSEQYIKQKNHEEGHNSEEDQEIKPPYTSTVQKFQIPVLPDPPNPQISQAEFQELAKQIFDIFGVQIPQKDHLLVKKYKNCAIFKTPECKKTVVWHFTGKFYFGGWEQNQNGEGRKNGDGFEYIPDKHCYQGQFYEGKRNGSGTMIQNNGNVYKGQWQRGQRHGLGSYYEESTGAIYEGEWKEGKKYGQGALKISDQEFYYGTFLKSVKHGFGKERFETGDSYKGQYKLGRFHGKGKYTWANGSSYDGNFVEGHREGRGVWKSAPSKGDSYIGEYVGDKKHGRGEYRWANGCRYIGHFREDLKHGEGRVEYPDGREVKGHWMMGKLVEIDQHIEEQDQKISHKDEPLAKRTVPVQQSPSKQLQASKNLHRL